MASDEHRTLVDRATRGDAPAVSALLERHLPGLLLYIRLHAGELLRRREESLDLCQSVCREVLEHAGSFAYRGEAAFRGWLFAQALGKIRDRQRYWLAEKRHLGREVSGEAPGGEPDLEALLPSAGSPSENAMRDEDLQRLERAFGQLSEEHRAVITRARLLGLPHAETARQMGRSEEAVRALLHRAMARLGILMDDGEA